MLRMIAYAKGSKTTDLWSKVLCVTRLAPGVSRYLVTASISWWEQHEVEWVVDCRITSEHASWLSFSTFTHFLLQALKILHGGVLSSQPIKHQEPPSLSVLVHHAAGEDVGEALFETDSHPGDLECLSFFNLHNNRTKKIAIMVSIQNSHNGQK